MSTDTTAVCPTPALSHQQIRDRLEALFTGHRPPTPPASAPQPEPHPRNRGQFTAGNPGGPGRPRKPRVLEQDLMTIIANAISDEDWEEMTRTAVEQAIEGNAGARRWLYQMLFKNSRATLSDAAAAAASGLSEDEHRVLLARERYGAAMQKAEEARRALQVAEAGSKSQEPNPKSERADGCQGLVQDTTVQDTTVQDSKVTPERVDEILAPGAVAAILAKHRTEEPSESPASQLRPHPKNVAVKSPQKRQITVENGRAAPLAV